jgi:hypothetical protein
MTERPPCVCVALSNCARVLVPPLYYLAPGAVLQARQTRPAVSGAAQPLLLLSRPLASLLLPGQARRCSPPRRGALAPRAPRAVAARRAPAACDAAAPRARTRRRVNLRARGSMLTLTRASSIESMRLRLHFYVQSHTACRRIEQLSRSCDDEFVLSIAGSDLAVCQWRPQRETLFF